MNYRNISITKYSTQTRVNCGRGGEFTLQFGTRTVVDPPPPRVAMDFIKYILKKCMPIIDGKSMVTFSDNRRDQLVDYLNKIGIEASKLFYMSAVVNVTPEEYGFFSLLEDTEDIDYKCNIVGDIELIKHGILPPLTIPTVTTS